MKKRTPGSEKFSEKFFNYGMWGMVASVVFILIVAVVSISISISNSPHFTGFFVDCASA